MNIDEPSAFAFTDNLSLPTAENTMNAVQRYWYNRGHEDGRKLTSAKELTDEEKWEVFINLARSPDLRADIIRFADSILRKAKEK